MLEIAVDKLTQRIQYVFDRIRDFRGVDFNLIAMDAIIGKKDIYIYSQTNNDESKGFKSSELLYEQSITKLAISKTLFGQQECLAFDGIVDPLASIFYHLTRMEEYCCFAPDVHGRFQAKDSFLVNYGWEKQLMVERWIDAFLEDYQRKMNRTLEIKYSPLSLTLTFDIDNTFAFKWKPFTRILGSYFKDFFRLDFKRMATKSATLLRFRKDPYNTYDKIISYHKKGINVHLFWLVGDFDKYDRNVSNTSVKHRRFINEIGDELAIGLHPSYASNESFDKLQKEKNDLEVILNHSVETSRQHFLRLRLPETYQRNQEVGLTADFTLGFGDIIGFRAGTIQKFPFFDLEKNQEQDYWIHPFSYMDGTLRDYLKLSAEQSKKVIEALIVEAHKYGGNFIAIWHNESISEWHNWKDWSKLIDYTIQKIDEVNH